MFSHMDRFRFWKQFQSVQKRFVNIPKGLRHLLKGTVLRPPSGPHWGSLNLCVVNVDTSCSMPAPPQTALHH